MDIERISRKDPGSDAYRSLWTATFGDADPDISCLLDALDADVYTLSEDGNVQSGLTLFYTGTFLGSPVYVSYAICTDTSARGKGYGSAITSFACRDVLSRNALSLLCPAEPSLVRFYEPLGYRLFFYACDSEKEFCVSSDRSTASDLCIEKLSVASYLELREELLREIPHIRISEELLNYVKAEESLSGDGLFRVKDQAGDDQAICVVSGLEEGRLFLSEFLTDSHGPDELLRLLALKFGVSRVHYRTTARVSSAAQTLGKTAVKPYIQAMLSAGHDADELKARLSYEDEGNDFLPYYGFPVD